MFFPAKLSLIVCCAPGESESLKKSLNALTCQSFKHFEVLVVSDGIDSNNKKVVKNFSRKLKAAYLERPNEKKLAASRNIGVKNASAEKIVMIDSDIELHEKALENYNEKLEKNPETVVLGKYQAENNIMRPFFRYKKFEDFINSPQNRILFYKPYFHSFFANAGITKKVYEVAGGSDESFTGYGLEDCALGLRLYRKGYRFNFCDDIAAVHHKRDKSSAFYHKSYMMKNSQRIISLIFDEAKEFFETDDELIIQNFKQVMALYDPKEVYTDLIRYLLLKGRPQEAFRYIPFSNQERVKSYFQAYSTGVINWKKLFYSRDYDMDLDNDAERNVFNLLWLYPLV